MNVTDITPSSILAAVAEVTPVVQTAGQTAVDLMRAAPETAGAIIAIPALPNSPRCVILQAGGDDAATLALLAASGGAVKVAELTFDGGALKNAAMSNAVANGAHALAAAINARIAAQKPTFSITSIVNAIEDEAKSPDGLAVDVVVYVDQTNMKVYAYKTEDDPCATALASFQNGLAQLDVDTTPAAAASNQFGE